MVLDLRNKKVINQELEKFKEYKLYFDHEPTNLEVLYANEEAMTLIHAVYDREGKVIKENGRILFVKRKGIVEFRKRT